VLAHDADFKVPQGPKPALFGGLNGTAKAVPFQNLSQFQFNKQKGKEN
jgi:hypothetical protein